MPALAAATPLLHIAPATAPGSPETGGVGANGAVLGAGAVPGSGGSGGNVRASGRVGASAIGSVSPPPQRPSVVPSSTPAAPISARRPGDPSYAAGAPSKRRKEALPPAAKGGAVAGAAKGGAVPGVRQKPNGAGATASSLAQAVLVYGAAPPTTAPTDATTDKARRQGSVHRERCGERESGAVAGAVCAGGIPEAHQLMAEHKRRTERLGKEGKASAAGKGGAVPSAVGGAVSAVATAAPLEGGVAGKRAARDDSIFKSPRLPNMASSWFKSPRTPANDMNQVTHVRMDDETPPAPVGARRAVVSTAADGGTDAGEAHAAFAVLSWPTTDAAAAAAATAAAAAAAPSGPTPTTKVTARAVWRAGHPFGPIPLVADSSASTAPDDAPSDRASSRAPSDAASTLGTTLGSNLGANLGTTLDPCAGDTLESTPTPQLTPRREWGGADTLERQAVLVQIRTVAATASATMGTVSSAASSTTSDASWDLGVVGTLSGTAADKGGPSGGAAAAAAAPAAPAVPAAPVPAAAAAAAAVVSGEAAEAAGSFVPGARATSFGKSAWTSPHARMQTSPQRPLHSSSGQPLLGEMEEGVVLPVRKDSSGSLNEHAVDCLAHQEDGLPHQVRKDSSGSLNEHASGDSLKLAPGGSFLQRRTGSWKNADFEDVLSRDRPPRIFSSPSMAARHASRETHPGDSVLARAGIMGAPPPEYQRPASSPRLAEPLSLHLDEVPSDLTSLFTHFDRNGDGRLDVHEFQQLMDFMISKNHSAAGAVAGAGGASASAASASASASAASTSAASAASTSAASAFAAPAASAASATSAALPLLAHGGFSVRAADRAASRNPASAKTARALGLLPTAGGQPTAPPPVPPPVALPPSPERVAAAAAAAAAAASSSSSAAASAAAAAAAAAAAEEEEEAAAAHEPDSDALPTMTAHPTAPSTTTWVSDLLSQPWIPSPEATGLDLASIELTEGQTTPPRTPPMPQTPPDDDPNMEAPTGLPLPPLPRARASFSEASHYSTSPNMLSRAASIAAEEPPDSTTSPGTHSRLPRRSQSDLGQSFDKGRPAVDKGVMGDSLGRFAKKKGVLGAVRSGLKSLFFGRSSSTTKGLSKGSTSSTESNSKR